MRFDQGEVMLYCVRRASEITFFLLRPLFQLDERAYNFDEFFRVFLWVERIAERPAGGCGAGGAPFARAYKRAPRN